MLNIEHPLYGSWRNMRSRCNNSSHPSYCYYGGRGIIICERWNCFDTFVSDMGDKPKGYSLDRIDNTGNYEPNNCRWADAQTQSTNRSIKSKFSRITFLDRTQSLTEWAKELDINYATLKRRFYTGWSVKRALTTKVGDPYVWK